MEWKELIGTERDVRLTVIEDNADIVVEFGKAISFIEYEEVAAFEVTCIAFNDESFRTIFPSTLFYAPKEISLRAGYSNPTETKALRANIFKIMDRK